MSVRMNGEATRAAFVLLAARSRSRHELQERLLKKGFSPDQVDAALTKLANEGYLDDGAFAVNWARGKLSAKPVGRARLRRELRAKGIAEGLIAQAIEVAYQEADELALALLSVERKLPSLRGFDLATKRRKLVAFLERRGFSPELTRRAIEEKLGKGDEDPSGVEEE